MSKMKYYPVEEACYRCGKPAHWGCHKCKKPLCYGCQYKTGRTITEPAIVEEGTEEHTYQQEVCIACYTTILGHPPLTLWQGSQVEVKLMAAALVAPGASFSAGSHDSWYQPPHAEKSLIIKDPAAFADSLDIFRVLQMLDFLQANAELIRSQASVASAILLPLARRMSERAIAADRRGSRGYEEE